MKARLLGVFSAALVSGVLYAETVDVDNITSLTNELDRLNRLSCSATARKDLGHVVRLAPGSYDVSGCHMACFIENNSYDYTQSRSHLAVACVTLMGTTDNPRDTVIYGDGSDRIIYAYGGTVQNLTISNGCVNTTSSIQEPAPNAGGGGITCRNESTYLVNCVVTACNAPEGDGGGAAVLCEARDCLFIGNRAKYGGGMANSRKGTAPNYRGGITNCTFIGNYALSSGGAIENCPIDSAVVISNSCENYGGGIFCNNSDCYIRNATAMYNHAVHGGGGVYHVGQRGTVSNCLISCNTTTHLCAGLFLSASGMARDSVVSNNVSAGVFDSSQGAGGVGGVFLGTLINCAVVDNATTGLVDNVYTCIGGGVREVTATNCLIAGNYASYAGGGAARSTLVGCIVSNNHAQCLGGGVYGVGIGGNTPMDVLGGKVVKNWVENFRTETGDAFKKSDGGGCYLATVSNAVVSGNSVIDPGRADRRGGGGAQSVFIDCEIAYNFAQVGAAAYQGTMKRCYVHDNATKSGSYLIDSVVDIDSCDIESQAFNCCVRIANSRIHDFDALGYATIPTGMNAHTNGTFVVPGELALFRCQNMPAPNQLAMTNCLVCNNYISHMFCGSNRGNDSIVNCSVISNNWDWQIYLLTNEGSNLEIVNSIFQGNMNRKKDAKRNFWPDSAAQHITISHCLFEGTADTGATVADGIRYWKDDAVETRTGVTVRFDRKADPAWPYQPAYSSLARGRGLVQNWMYGALDVRNDAQYPRLRDGKVDIGCYQNWHIPVGSLFLVR